MFEWYDEGRAWYSWGFFLSQEDNAERAENANYD